MAETQPKTTTDTRPTPAYLEGLEEGRVLAEKDRVQQQKKKEEKRRL